MAVAMIRCIKLRRFEKNTLQGFADFELTRVGLVIHDCTWHEKNGKEWIGFPSRQYQDKAGNIQWSPLVEFAAGATEARRQFQEFAVGAIHDWIDEHESEVTYEPRREPDA
jgi:hypothetical protein